MPRRPPVATALLVVAAAGGCGDSDAAATWLDDPGDALPSRLSQLGAYEDDLAQRKPAARAIEFTPAWPLWSSGSDKQRLLVVPAGETVDITDPAVPRFPPGTVLLKTFGYESGPVETRVLWAQPDGAWAYETYRWDEDGADATLLDGKRETVVQTALGAHSIPSRLQCRECHETAPSPVLGLRSLQWPDVLPQLQAAGVVQGSVPEAPRRVADAAPDEATASVLGDFVGNCLHCHNGSDADNASFDLDPAVALDNTVGVETQSSASAAGVRIVPGQPGSSILFLAVSGEHEDPEIESMPPVGIDRIDPDMVDRLRALIEGLPTR